MVISNIILSIKEDDTRLVRVNEPYLLKFKTVIPSVIGRNQYNLRDTCYNYKRVNYNYLEKYDKILTFNRDHIITVVHDVKIACERLYVSLNEIISS